MISINIKYNAATHRQLIILVYGFWTGSNTMLGKNLKPTEKINNVGNGGSLHDIIAFSIGKSQRN